jgi:hypothetical protein
MKAWSKALESCQSGSFETSSDVCRRCLAHKLDLILVHPLQIEFVEKL